MHPGGMPAADSYRVLARASPTPSKTMESEALRALNAQDLARNPHGTRLARVATGHRLWATDRMNDGWLALPVQALFLGLLHRH